MQQGKGGEGASCPPILLVCPYGVGSQVGSLPPPNRILRHAIWVTPVPLGLLPGGDRGHGHPRGAHQTRAPVASPQSPIPAGGGEASDRWQSQEGRVDSQQDLWHDRRQQHRPPSRGRVPDEGRQVSKAATAGKQQRPIRGEATWHQSQAGGYSPTPDPPRVSAPGALTWQPCFSSSFSPFSPNPPAVVALLWTDFRVIKVWTIKHWRSRIQHRFPPSPLHLTCRTPPSPFLGFQRRQRGEPACGQQHAEAARLLHRHLEPRRGGHRGAAEESVRSRLHGRAGTGTGRSAGTAERAGEGEAVK